MPGLAAVDANLVSGDGLKHVEDGLTLLTIERQVEIVAVGVFNVQAALPIGNLEVSLWAETG